MSIVEGARQVPLHHITIRVPWHDSGWNGAVCKSPCNNTSCLNLTRIADRRDDQLEDELAGRLVSDLSPSQYPPCVEEHATIMASFEVDLEKKHPYKSSNDKTHGHFDDTPYIIPGYSVATCVTSAHMAPPSPVC